MRRGGGTYERPPGTYAPTKWKQGGKDLDPYVIRRGVFTPAEGTGYNEGRKTSDDAGGETQNAAASSSSTSSSSGEAQQVIVGGDPEDDGDDSSSSDDDGPIEYTRVLNKALPRGTRVTPKGGCPEMVAGIVRRWNAATQNEKYISEQNVIDLMGWLSFYLAKCPPWAYGKKKTGTDEFKTVQGSVIEFEVDEDWRYFFPVQREVLGGTLLDILTRIQEADFPFTLSQFAMKAARKSRTSEAQHMVATLAYEGYSENDPIETRVEWAKNSIDLKRYLDVRTSVQWLITPAQWLVMPKTVISPLIYAINQYDGNSVAARRCFRELMRDKLKLWSLNTAVTEFSPLQVMMQRWKDTPANREVVYGLVSTKINIDHRGKGLSIPAIAYAILGGKIKMASLLAREGSNPQAAEKRMNMIYSTQSDDSPSKIKALTAYTAALVEYNHWLQERNAPPIQSVERTRNEPQQNLGRVRSSRTTAGKQKRDRDNRAEARSRKKQQGTSLRDQIAIRAYFRAHEEGDLKKASTLLAERIPTRYHKHIQSAHNLFATN